MRSTEGDVVEVVESASAQSVDGASVEVVVVCTSRLLYNSLADRYSEESHVIVREQTADLPAAAARNLGADVASGDVYAFVEPGMTLDDEWAENLLQPYSESDALAVAGPVRPVWDDASGGRKIASELYRLIGCTVPGFNDRVSADAQEIARMQAVAALNISFRACVFEELDGFDVGFARRVWFPRCEVVKLCYRLQLTRGECPVYAADAKVVRHFARGRPSVPALLRRGWWQGRLRERLMDEYPNLFVDSDGLLRGLASGAGREASGIAREPTASRMARSGLLVAVSLLVGLGYLYETLTT